MKIHFIAIGGALMHNLALALAEKPNYIITGSDDEIYDPSRSRLAAAKLLPEEMGWHPNRVHADLDAIIVGMHARANNPELLKAQSLGLTIYSYPEFIYLQSQQKKRVVVGGSHGKTTTTSMIMHVLKYHNIDFDYAVGAQIEGFDLMVRLSDAPIIVIEGDEYLSSPIDELPKFLHYHPHVAVVTGIAWDHINVFPTFKKYKKQFKKFIQSVASTGALIYYKQDEYLHKYADKSRSCLNLAYDTPPYSIENGQTYLSVDYNINLNNLKQQNMGIPLQVFGQHNLQNLQAARLATQQLGITDYQFHEAIQSFKGASKRLEKIQETESHKVYRDFAHAPSKVQASTKALKQQYPETHLVAVLELHTYSSLNYEFIEEYQGSLSAADTAFVYYNEHTLKMKKMAPLHTEDVEDAFFHPNIKVLTDASQLKEQVQNILKEQQISNLLLMSSGNFGKMDLTDIIPVEKTAKKD